MNSRRIILAAAFAGFIAHAALIYAYGRTTPGPLLADLVEFAMGIGVAVTAYYAMRRSDKYPRTVWALASIALALYAAGQGLVTYYRHVLHAPLLSPWFSSQFLFFWAVPLALAALIRRDQTFKGFNWPLALDFCQVFMIALTLHLSVFAISANWQIHGQELQYLEWKMRMFRDAIVLAALFSRTVFSGGRTRRLFLRFAAFFLAYAVVSAIYLYAESAWSYTFGWLDLLWGVPRLIMIWGAITWADQPYTVEEERARAVRQRRGLPLHMASMLGPLMVAMIALPISPTAPVMAGGLILASFSFAALRLMLTQDLHEDASRELRSSLTLLEAVVENTTEAIYVRDLEGRYLLANPAARRILGGASLDVVGRANDEFFAAHSAQTIRESDQQVINSNSDLETEQTFEMNGKVHTLIARKSPFRDAAGKAIGVLGVAIDITERRKMEAELRRSQRMESIGTLAAGVAHDFNNLLTVIKGYSQLVMEDPTAEAAPAQLREIDSAATKAESLTRQLLAFSRQQVMQPRVTNLNDIVKDIEKMLRRLIGADVELVVLPASVLQSVRLDPGQIEQVIMNLAANARDAMPRGGKLTISTTNTMFEARPERDGFAAPLARYVMLAVSDTGEGMDEATQARMFEPFYTTKPVGKGTGLGLSTVYGITKQS